MLEGRGVGVGKLDSTDFITPVIDYVFKNPAKVWISLDDDKCCMSSLYLTDRLVYNTK